MIINKKTRSLIMFVFYHEKEIEDLVMEKRLDPNLQRMGGGGRAFVSNPTETTAIRNLCPLRDVVIQPLTKHGNPWLLKSPEEWLAAIKRIREVYKDTKQGQIFDLKFDLKLADQEIRDRLHISKQTYYLWLNDIIRFAHGYSEGSGAVKDGNKR